MTPKLSDDQRKAIEQYPGQPVTVEDDRTQAVYVLLPIETYQKVQSLLSDDSELTPEEMLAAAAEALDNPSGWGAPGMEEYDHYDSDSQPS